MSDTAKQQIPAGQEIEARLCPTCDGRAWVHVNADQFDILKMIADRVKFGIKKYGKGIEVGDNYDWTKEALEEVSDGMQYVAAALLRLVRTGGQNGNGR